MPTSANKVMPRMLDEASLRRLAEMGIDAYVPRAVAPQSAAGLPSPGRAQESAKIRVLMLADTKAAPARMLTAQVHRALASAGVECTVAASAEQSALENSAGLVIFGETLARQAGALLPAARQQSMGWVAAADAASVARDAHAKRALWSELRRMLRVVNGLAAVPERSDDR
jgi:hypothetical protein